MRRALREELPALAYNFGLRWEHIERMPRGELRRFRDALEDLPPMGAVVPIRP